VPEEDLLWFRRLFIFIRRSLDHRPTLTIITTFINTTSSTTITIQPAHHRPWRLCSPALR
jgi:hypothetical protein